ncbi:MAG: RNA-guided pseudouridylation complex pseudouridine synthase subunit Cbf5 [Candidatus Thermoplasmatota archaeon]|nr:RNA-guided pseudouridylation complex pseudouridine synthase subunit Cbf5 [Candidatus Thermoplasmatota archaeon]
MQNEGTIDGFIVVDKPKGPTSHQVDYWIREILGVQKVGHIGTLDPGVSGVLVMAIGNAVRLIDVAHEFPKEYVAVMKLHHEFSTDKLNEVMEKFTGEIYQIPPMRSAVARSLRKRNVYGLDILEIHAKDVLFKVRCESGTYIRTLCTDMGYLISFGGQMAELRRTATGPFNETMLCTLQDVSDAVKMKESGDSTLWDKIFLPMEFLFRTMPKIVVKNSAIKNLSHGSDLFPGGIRAILGSPLRGDRVALISETNQLLGTGKMLVSYNEVLDMKVVDLDRVLIEPTGVKKDVSKGKLVGDRGREQGKPFREPGRRVRPDFRQPKKRGYSGNNRGKGRDTRSKRTPDRVRRTSRKN